MVGYAGAEEDVAPWISPSNNEIIYGVSCHCEGECISPLATIGLKDSMGNTISTATLTCDTGDAASTYVPTSSMDPDRILSEGERLLFDITNSPGSNDRVTICVKFVP